MSGEIGGSRLGNVIKAKEDLLKSPEQLEKEKREIISSRLVKINLDRLTKDDLVEEVRRRIFAAPSSLFVIV
jgi:flagellar biosynthesis/type III secretory pathway chaperone